MYGVIFLSLEETVLQIIKDMSVTCETPGIDNLLLEDLGYDSLGMVDLIVELEDTLNITFDISELDPNALKKVNDIINLVIHTVER